MGKRERKGEGTKRKKERKKERKIIIIIIITLFNEGKTLYS